jgi:hypothetical protein
VVDEIAGAVIIHLLKTHQRINTMAPAKISLRKFIAHAIDREYMSGVSREKARVKATGEVFTPNELVREMMDQAQKRDPTIFTDMTAEMLDPCCGDGQILVHFVLYKLISGDLSKLADDEFLDKDISVYYRVALDHVYGVDLMMDNVIAARERLSMGYKRFNKILENNIRCENALTYDFQFLPIEK